MILILKVYGVLKITPIIQCPWVRAVANYQQVKPPVGSLASSRGLKKS